MKISYAKAGAPVLSYDSPNWLDYSGLLLGQFYIAFYDDERTVPHLVMVTDEGIVQFPDAVHWDSSAGTCNGAHFFEIPGEVSLVLDTAFRFPGIKD